MTIGHIQLDAIMSNHLSNIIGSRISYLSNNHSLTPETM